MRQYDYKRCYGFEKAMEWVGQGWRIVSVYPDATHKLSMIYLLEKPILKPRP